MKPLFKITYDYATLLDDISSEVAIVLEQTCEDIVDLTKQLAPIDTGDLRASYMFEKVDDYTYRIGSNPYRGVYKRGHPTTYAPYVEFGTTDSPAQPHFTPASRQIGDTLVTRLEQAIRRRVK